MQEKLYRIIETSDDTPRLSSLYNTFMMVTIIVSLLPLTVKQTEGWVNIVDKLTVSVFVLDYVLRLFTAPVKMQRGVRSYFLYPFTPMAIIDLLAILPSFNVLEKGFRVLKLLRLLRTMRVFRVFKFARYSKSLRIILNVLKHQQTALLAVCSLAVGYIFVSALIVFNVEPETFGNFFEAIYWASVSLTTVGYGDIYPITTIGRMVTIVSSIFGIAIVALPAGIITAGYMEELQNAQ